MQQANKNKQDRNKRIQQLRSKLKKVPILHTTTDRVQKLISEQKNAQQNIRNSSSTSFDANKSQTKVKSKNQMDFQTKFTLGKKIGEGAHGIVRECFHKQTKKLFALKTIRSDKEFFYYLKRNFVNIIELDHRNIIKYKAFYFDNRTQTCLLVMDYLPFPNLSQIQIENQEEIKQIIYEVIQGLQYLHENFLCHRDIKLENILYDKQNRRSIIIDFGVSAKFYHRGYKKDMLTLTGTPYYRAPEMFTGGGYDQRVDIWALGILIFKMIAKVTPFQSQYHCDTINNILKGQFTYDPKIWGKYDPVVKDLINHLLKPKQSRLTLKQVKNHFWFSNLNDGLTEGDLSRSVGFDGFFDFKRTVTDSNRNSYVNVRPRHPTLSPIITPLTNPNIFNLQKYKQQQNHEMWINLQGSQYMDLIQSQDEQTSSSPTPKFRPKAKKQSKKQLKLQESRQSQSQQQKIQKQTEKEQEQKK